MSETNPQDLDRLITKVRKLLALAADARGNENEAANAAAVASRLVAEHGMDLAQIEARGEGPEGGQREKARHDRAAMYCFQRSLMEGIAKNNMCRYWTEEVHAHSFGKLRKVKRHMLLGRTVNVAATLAVYDYLVATMDRLLPWQGSDLRGKNALAWLDGCTERLVERLNEQRRQMEAEAEALRWNGEDAAMITLVLQGYSADLARSLVAKRFEAERAAAKPETDAQRRAREAREDREERQEQRWKEAGNRYWAKEDARRNDPAFRAGHRTGGEIGLDT